MAEIRTFIAVAVDRAIIERLTALQREWREVGADLSWVRPEGMHLTLKFLGNVPEDSVSALGDALARVAVRYAPFPLSVAGTGGFPTLRHPRVLWAGIETGQASLIALAQAVDDELATLGIPRETKAFHPHLTLARVKSSANLPQLVEHVVAHHGEQFGEMRVEQMQLIRSELSPQGARYTLLRDLPFTGIAE